MSSGDDITPTLGRPGDAGSGAGRRFSRAIRRRAAQLAKPKSKSGLARGRIQRGGAAARMASVRQTRFAPHRMRRAVVQVYIARASKSGGSAGFAKHAQYLQRDGVDRDGHAGEVYDRRASKIDAEPFINRSKDDRHQFRIMVSPEDGLQLGDLKPHIRAFMATAEKDLGTRLDWVAVDHHNTGRPHTHIIVRGRTDDGLDLVIAKDYLTKGLRRRASELVTEALGPRRDLEIMRAEQSQVARDRRTGLDHRLARMAEDHELTLAKPATSRDRFKTALARQRLRYLQKLGLAKQIDVDRWALVPNWENTLRHMGRRDDLIRAITAKYSERDIANRVRPYDASKVSGLNITGRVIGSVPVDELRARRHVLVEGLDGRTWSVNVGEGSASTLPSRGTIVDLIAITSAPKRSDQTIARIAALNGGRWSEAIHAENDPGSSPPYRLAHKRRLEALRRSGLLDRRSDGVWEIPPDYLDRAARFEGRKKGAAEIKTITAKSLSGMETANAYTWLDRVDARGAAQTGFGRDVRRAQAQRRIWLQDQGFLDQDEVMVSARTASILKSRELSRLARTEHAKSGRAASVLEQGQSFSGEFEKIIDSHQGRMALIGNETKFALIPMRAKMASSLGKEMTVSRKGQSIDWTLGRKRGLGR